MSAQETTFPLDHAAHARLLADGLEEALLPPSDPRHIAEHAPGMRRAIDILRGYATKHDGVLPLMSAEQALRIVEERNPAAAVTHDSGIPLTRRLDCGHCPHEICQDCNRCPHTCRCGSTGGDR